MKTRCRGICLFAVGTLALLAQQARADIVGFERITSNNSADVAAQLFAEVTDAGGGQVDFKFTNAIGIDSSITDIYFDDGAGVLAAIASIFVSDAGVAFSEGSSPPDLPGGNSITPQFNATAGLTADSDAPAAPNGVDSASEWVTLRFDLVGGKTFADVIAALELGGSAGLRIGLHVQSINDAGEEGGSDAFINTPPEDRVIPAPGATVLALIGMGLVGRFRRIIA